MLTRRGVLRSVTTGAALHPLLWRAQRTVGRGVAWAASPKRLLIFWQPQGNCVGQGTPDPFWPMGSGTEFTMSQILTPLAKHRADLLLLKGFHTPVGGPDGAHGAGTMCALTNTPSIPVSSTRHLGGGISIDQEIASAVGGQTPRPSLVLTGGGTKTSNHRGFVSYAAAGQPITPESDPRSVYASLFAGAGGAGDPRAAKLQALRKSALDVLVGDVRRLRARVPAEERHKLDAQLESVRVLERGLTASDCTVNKPLTFPDGRLPPFPTQHALHFKTIAAAFACDMTRVVTFMGASGGGDTAGDLSHFDGWKGNYHSTGHASGGNRDGGGEDPAVRAASREVMIKVSTYFAQQLAEFIDQLKSIPEGSGTVFDNTVIYWCSEMAHGNHGNLNSSQVIIGGRWHFRTGQLLTFPGGLRGQGPDPVQAAQENPYGNILVPLANAMGHPITTFGSPKWMQPAAKYAAMLARG